MWLGEAEAYRAEMRMRHEGAPSRDLSDYSRWREEAEPDNLQLLELYGAFLVGQHAGMTDALSLPAVIAAMDIVDTDPGERAETARRLIVLHSIVREHERRREKQDG